MRVGLGTKLNLFELDLYLFLLRLGLLLGLLVFELAVIHDTADRGDGCRRNLYQIQLLALSQRQSLAKRKNTKLLTFGTYYPHLFGPDCLIDVDCRFSYDATSYL
ncbi:hypothetical protein GMPD_20520 [Geomonas paludis]|uniref:Uncharacterized protein n=1 Tax=Geomonas paludis TaxID=2740185 RepID=A0A6V8MX62_9BACT|nr:hypothetical protein GMPD_20520 [Geomonas paludis]